ncbi:hypothetical protein [Bacillus cereus]|uniref:Phage protein n=1 Tax=Bacillus cereus TIAC219 TaxID=718222 RepID=A0ABC9SQG9_BACCE|nr:hypothetical protein [Bacillus cereus]EJP81116.1 hypothetical protein IC1_06604 [Bacillus cereus VD022]EOQ57855.1 hypothetical protein IAY_06231 [Bacillus cereus TIAC219]
MIKLKQAKNVGELIEVLSQYKFSTPINTTCNECRHGWSGGSVSVEDFTNQTYGYIDLHINQSGYKSNMTRDEKEFKIYQMAHLLGQRVGSLYDKSDHDLHVTYRSLWRDLEVESIRL